MGHDGGHPWEFDAVLELLATTGHEVVVLVPSPALSARGTDVGILRRLAQSSTVVLGSSALVAFADGEAEVRNVLTGTLRRELGFDSLVLAFTRQAESSLAGALRPHVSRVEVVGDGLAPRGVRDAVWEGRAAARRIGA